MSRIVIALVLIALAVWVAANTRSGYRSGRMPLWVGGVNPLVFDRASVPAWFWAATIVNAVFTGFFTLAGILMLVVDPTR